MKLLNTKLGITMLEKYESNNNISLLVEGLLIADDTGVRLTRKGRFVGNEVFQQFLLGE